MPGKWIHFFGSAANGKGPRLGGDAAREALGGKGAGLAEMTRAGLPVPPGFTITTDVCRRFYSEKDRRRLSRADTPLRQARLFPKDFLREFIAGMRRLETATGRTFADPENPLLVSVRSGAKFSMPGMMDTILNLGLNDRTVRGLERQTHNPRFAWDSYRRFIQMFGNVVRGIEKSHFEAVLDSIKTRGRLTGDSELSTQSLQKVVSVFHEIYKEHTGTAFPQDPAEQLRLAVLAVFESWNNPRAIAYRKLNRIPDDLGTACNIQAMVFGNMGDTSATGVGFTRNPSSGEKEFYGEFLPDAQGEDVVAGVRTPRPIAELRDKMPRVHKQLREIAAALERHYRDVQDIEFTVERGALYMLQTRTAKRTAEAALRVAVDMVAERLISREEAILRVSPEQLDQLLRPVFDAGARARFKTVARGLPAGPGAASGRIAFTAERAVAAAPEGPVLLVRPETNPDDILGMTAAQGILTATGGLTSHAAVVGRGMGKVCIVGCSAIELDPRKGVLRVGARSFKEGDFLSLDGFSGEVLDGSVPTRPSEVLRALRGDKAAARGERFRYYRQFMSWVDAARRLRVRANADTPEDARTAVALGAEGVGLCRTEHMFFGEDRIGKMLAMIVAETEEERYRALEQLFPLQKEDFKRIFREMRGFPVTIRTLDPPLHEFLPHTREEAQRRCKTLGLDAARVWAKSLELREANPMLGHRGCRLGVTYPEITEMQVRAIVAAACELKAEGVSVHPEIMIPLVGYASELRHQRAQAVAAAEETMTRAKTRVPVSIGTMIEVPRAAVTAGEIAEEAEFFSFGTNDLTQMALGFSRDDYGRFIGKYLELKILREDPFRSLDQTGVGALVQLALEKGRAARPQLKAGVCGEHGGDPDSVGFFHRAGVDYVSCSPYRVPVARLAAAQAAVRGKAKENSTA